MKTKFLLLIASLFFVINSCNVVDFADVRQAEITQSEQAASIEEVLSKIIPDNQDKHTYINVINSDYCFSCYPVFNVVCGQMKEAGYHAGNLVYVFPSMRKVMQTDFLMKNFNLSPQDATVIFDDDVYNSLQQEYELEGSSKMLCFDQNKELLAMSTYERANVAEVLSIVN